MLFYLVCHVCLLSLAGLVFLRGNRRWGGKNELGRVQGDKTVFRMHCMREKNLFSIKKNEEKELCVLNTMQAPSEF